MTLQTFGARRRSAVGRGTVGAGTDDRGGVAPPRDAAAPPQGEAGPTRPRLPRKLARADQRGAAGLEVRRGGAGRGGAGRGGAGQGRAGQGRAGQGRVGEVQFYVNPMFWVCGGDRSHFSSVGALPDQMSGFAPNHGSPTSVI